MSPGRGSTPRHTDWTTVSRIVTLTLTMHSHHLENLKPYIKCIGLHVNQCGLHSVKYRRISCTEVRVISRELNRPEEAAVITVLCIHFAVYILSISGVGAPSSISAACNNIDVFHYMYLSALPLKPYLRTSFSFWQYLQEICSNDKGTPQCDPCPFMLCELNFKLLDIPTHFTIKKKSVFLDMRTQFVPHRRHVTTPLQIPVA
jgi:hypothetical protein